MTLETPVAVAPAVAPLPTIPAHFHAGRWVARFDNDPNRPQLAQIREAYHDSFDRSQFLLDLVFYAHDGEKLGRVSPALGGPRKYEPACPASLWVAINKPDFERLSGERYGWGHLVKLSSAAQEAVDDEVLHGKAAIYPGHPVTLAYAIVRTFASLDEARDGKDGVPGALAHEAVPGARGCVMTALDLLKRASTAGIDSAIAYGDLCWAGETESAYADRRHSGQMQADRVKPVLREKLLTWLDT